MSKLTERHIQAICEAIEAARGQLGLTSCDLDKEPKHVQDAVVRVLGIYRVYPANAELRLTIIREYPKHCHSRSMERARKKFDSQFNAIFNNAG